MHSPLFFWYNKIMIKLLTYTSSRNKFLEFNFKEVSINYNENYNWVEVQSPKQYAVFNENSFLAYDDEIYKRDLDIGWGWMNQDYIQSIYKYNNAALVICSQSDMPLCVLYGKDICLRKKVNNYIELEIDGKKVYLYNFHFMTLSRIHKEEQ